MSNVNLANTWLSIVGGQSPGGGWLAIHRGRKYVTVDLDRTCEFALTPEVVLVTGRLNQAGMYSCILAGSVRQGFIYCDGAGPWTVDCPLTDENTVVAAMFSLEASNIRPAWRYIRDVEERLEANPIVVYRWRHHVKEFLDEREHFESELRRAITFRADNHYAEFIANSDAGHNAR